MSAEVDRRRIETDAEIISELRESNLLSRCEIVEAKQNAWAEKSVMKQLIIEAKRKAVAEISVVKQLDDELRLESIAEVDRKRVVEAKVKMLEKAKDNTKFRRNG